MLPFASAGASVFVYTQVSDVEDETNGLLTYDRAVCKVDEGRMREMAKSLHTAFENKYTSERN